MIGAGFGFPHLTGLFISGNFETLWCRKYVSPVTWAELAHMGILGWKSFRNYHLGSRYDPLNATYLA